MNKIYIVDFYKSDLKQVIITTSLASGYDYRKQGAEH